MKSFPFPYLLLFFTLISGHLLSQNWNLIRQNERYHYLYIDDTIPLHTLFIDSVEVVNSDSVFYMNRFFLPCDTCTQEGYYLDNQPGFLQRQIRKTVQGQLILENPTTNIIQVTGNVGDEWWFDAEQTQKAKLASKTWEPVFGINDSIIRIIIDDKAHIKISKNYGLLYYFGYSLSGLEKAGLGKCLPGFKEFYDFEAGDAFQYKTTAGSGGEGGPSGHLKIKVLGVEIFIDSTKVEFESMYRPMYYPFEGECIHYQYKTTLLNPYNHLSNTYPNQKIPVYSYFYSELIENLDEWYDVSYTFTEVYSENSLLVKDIGFDFDYGDKKKGPFSEVSHGLFIKINPNDDFPSKWIWKYQVGLGLTYFKFQQFETWRWQEQVGYIKDGIQFGSVESDQWMLGVEERDAQPKLTIYPNPASDKIVINGTTSIDVVISIYNISGMLLKQIQLPFNKEIEVSDLEPGIYLVQIKTEEWIVTKRLIISRP